MNITMSSSSAAPSDIPTPQSGIAGRTNYAQWDKLATDLVETVEREEEQEAEAEKAALGLNGKYARSQAEAEEREKLKTVKKTKKKLEQFKKREAQLMTTFAGLLGPVVVDEHDNNDQSNNTQEETKSTEPHIVRITRDRMDAGKRVIGICDTSGASLQDTIVLTQDLSHLESKMRTNAMTPKTYEGDAENNVPEDQTERSIFGLIKVFISNVHNCTILVKCKVISGTVEIHNCSNVVIRVESTGTVATVQADLSENITLEFRDAPSGKNTAPPQQPKNVIYWGEDKDDRIFHAGVKNFHIKVIRDGYVDTEIVADYIKDGAVSIGNATAEEFQFITSVIDGVLKTEKVVRAGSTTGKNARAMTEREIEEEKKRRERATTLAVAMAEDMIQIKDKEGNVLVKKEAIPQEEVIEEVWSPMVEQNVKDVVEECEMNKSRGNEAFGAGEYGQAILLYSLALDKAEELPEGEQYQKLVPRDILYSNRSACFLKLGQHEKAEEDARKALEINPENIKANFRRGLALHAMGKYFEALPVLAAAYKLEPHNKQVKQALQFCEVRITQEQRKRMGA